ncbi:AlpA family phage regulatory protein [Moraxella sp. FZLJ2107]|uniref:helix-turn-helix transcriptional regulator n=1 Tax=unclassified Moraxella TaxID=2685852 RepID=UPI0020C8E0BC|nr:MULTISPECIES: AlpA family phage regulatory protein [unclassified Moraxella]UTO04917.1 AlpA family phage regulatory protein [Moraxella sp. FZLJ2107]UTO21651.1 AlpA family phage regulatory protein [Moraxella sp. FZLJ2109]
MNKQPTLSPQGMSRLKDILPLLPFGKSTLWRMVKDGTFPQPIRFGTHCTAWKNSEVLAWIEQQGGKA